MSEWDDALALADRLLDEPNADPDDDLRMLARHLLRSEERRRAAYAQGVEDAAKRAKGVRYMPDKYNHYWTEFGRENDPDAPTWSDDGNYMKARNAAESAIRALKDKGGQNDAG